MCLPLVTIMVSRTAVAEEQTGVRVCMCVSVSVSGWEKNRVEYIGCWVFENSIYNSMNLCGVRGEGGGMEKPMVEWIQILSLTSGSWKARPLTSSSPSLGEEPEMWLEW